MGEATSLLSDEEGDINTLNTDGESLLHIACKYSHLNCVKSLAVCYRYINFKDTKDTKDTKKAKDTKDAQNSSGDTALHLACYGKSIHLIRILLEIKCSINIPNKKGETAQNIPLNEDGDCLLHIACQWGDVGIVRYLIDQRCVLSIQNTHLNTPIHLACYEKNLSIIRFFLKQKCSTSIPNKKGETVQDIPLNEDGDCLLHIACQWGDVDVVRYLITDEKCNPIVQSSTYENTPLHIAAKYGQDDTIAQLLSCKECNPNAQNKEGDTPLHLAATWNKTAAVPKLLAHQQIDVNAQNKEGNTPLHLACYKRSLDVVKLLLKMRYSTSIPNKKGETVQNIPLNEDGDRLLHIACQWGDVDIVRYLITDEKCNPIVQSSTSKNTPLHIAAKYGQDDTIAQLLSYKECNPYAQNKDGNTPLHLAATYGHDDTIAQLLSYKQCNPNAQNKDGDTPLHLAVSLNKTAVVPKLLAHQQVDVNAQNKDGDTPLHLAATWNKTAAVPKLLAHQQIEVNAQNKKGNTPLHLACYKRSLDVVKLFLKMRYSTNITNKKGETAQNTPLNEDGDCLLHIACQWGDVDIVRYLITDEKCNPIVQSSTSENTPLHIAAKYGQDDTIAQLLSYKQCNPNAQNKDGDTPLHLAVSLNETAAISNLLAHQQIEVNAQNKEGNTPLHLACYKRSLDVVKLFLKMRYSTNITNKKGETAQNIPLNEDGDCLLHIACQWGDVDIVRYLITDEKCNPNFQRSTSENTPLHIAAKYGQDDTIVQLLSYKKCDPNAQNKEGDTPLHFAVRWSKKAAISNLLAHQQCNPNPQNKKGDTPLHTAARYGQDDAIVQLLSCMKCNPNLQNKEGDTPLHIVVRYGQDDAIVQLLSCKRCDPNFQDKEGDTPLHIVVRENRTRAIPQLLSNKDCNPNILNNGGDTPLHITVRENRTHAISQLLSNKHCNPNILNNGGDTPLHIVVRENRTHAISQLLSNKHCNPNILNNGGDTPLHVAIRHEQEDTIVQLLSCKECNPNALNKEGDTPLHIAVRDNRGHVISQLLSNKDCNLNIYNKYHLTPLLIAIKHNNHRVATDLLQHKKCDPTLCDPHGNTPLHLACIGGETQPRLVEVAEQLLTSVDPSCVNNAGQTPIELTTNYQLIQAISRMVKCKRKQSVQTYINMFIVGNPETGKSTLVKAICKEATGILWKIVPKQLRRVKNVPLHTAGIIPTTFRSKTFGNTVLYDLAGQVEYYTSHAAVIRSTVISTPPAFVVVVNLSESEEKISETLRYWWSFIDNHAAQSSAPSQVILVGSHADVIKSTGGSVQEKMTRMSALLKKLSASFHFAGHVALDTRDPASKGLRLFCFLVNQSCTVLREKADVDLHCHVLYAFLLERFKGKVACTVSDVATSVKENRELLPQNSDRLIPLISALSDKGLLLLVEGVESHENWWIILQKQALLGKINGTIFAPKSFSQHKDLSWSTGVVPFFKLKNEFPDYNPIMVSGFLTHLEFCFKIEDNETLALLKDKTSGMEDNYRDVSEEYYFFPALVSVENPLDVWEQNDDMCCKSGWFYQCIKHDQFLSTQFLHVLILRLAFNFALNLDPGDCREESLTVRRKCSVWKHGIGWRNLVQIETVVEVGLQHQSVIVLIRCPKGKKAECVQLRSEVIQKVLEVKDEHCKAVKMSESFIHPTDVRYPFTDKFKDYSLTGIARVIIEGTTHALDRTLKNPIPFQDLLLLDTCTSIELLIEIFSKKHSMDEEIRSQVLETLNGEYIEL